LPKKKDENKEKKRKGERADGRLCKNVTIGRNEDGSLKRKMVYANTQAELKLKVAELLLQKEKGVIIDDKNKTVDVWADEWLATYTTNLKDSTKYNHKKMINKYIKPNFNDVRLKDLKQYQVQKVLNEIKSESVPKRFLITINKILDAAVENDFISKNVAKALTAPKFQEEPKQPLSNEQIKIIQMTEHELRNLCVFLIYSGLRISELKNLTWQNVDMKNKKIYVTGDVKTLNSNRGVPILEPVNELLKQFSANGIKNIDADKDFVFLYRGQQLNPNILSKQRYEYCALCGFKFTFHQCRHTFATILYNAGIDIKQAQEWLGHANFNTTMNIYTHLSEQNKTTSTDKLNEYLKTV
jgi:integrase